MCNCGNTITTNTICTTCVPTDCACPIKDLSTDCIQYTGDDLPCTEILQGTLMTEVIGQLDTYLCDLSEQLANSFSLVSIGTGTRVFRGVDGIGRKEIRTIVPINGIITIGLSTNDKEIQIGVDSAILKSFIQANQITYSASNVGTGAGVYKQAVRTGDNVNLSFKKIRSSQSAISIVEGTDDINITIDGSETKVQAGASISVAGIGTVVSPYVITNTAPDQTVVLTSGTGISATGTYPSFTITNTAPDQTVAITAGAGVSVTGTYPNFTITNTSTSTGSQDLQQVTTLGSVTTTSITASSFIKSGNVPGQILMSDGSVITAGTNITIAGGTISASGGGTAGVTSVSGTGTVSGLTLSGTVTSTGNLTFSGALVLTSLQVTLGLGFTPYRADNPLGFTSFAEPGIFSGGGTPTLASGVTGAEIRTLIGAGTPIVDADFVKNTADIYPTSAKIEQIITLSQAEYDAIVSPLTSTLYIIL